MTDGHARSDDAGSGEATDKEATRAAGADGSEATAGATDGDEGLDEATGDPADGDESTPGTASRVRTYLLYATLVGLVLLATIGVVNFYLAANAAIRQWVAPEFRQPFRAAFNLVVVLLSAAGAFALLRRL